MEKRSGQKKRAQTNEIESNLESLTRIKNRWRQMRRQIRKNHCNFFHVLESTQVPRCPCYSVVLYCVVLCFIEFHCVSLCFIMFHCVLVILHCIVFHCVWDGFQFEYFHSPHPHALALCTKIKGNLGFYPLRNLLALKVNINWT